MKITANGYSMYPFYSPNSTLLIGNTEIKRGYCVLASTNIWGYRVHRVIEVDNTGRYKLKGDGCRACENEWISDDNVIGVVIGFFNEDITYLYLFQKFLCRFMFLLLSKLSKWYAISNLVFWEPLEKRKKESFLSIIHNKIYNLFVATIRNIINGRFVSKTKSTKIFEIQ